MDNETDRTNQVANRWYDYAALFLALVYALQSKPKTNSAPPSGEDSKNDRLARYTGQLNLATWVIAIAAIVNLVVAYAQWNALKSTDTATHDLARTALDQVTEMRNQQRPIILTPTVSIVTPITFDASTKDAQITLDYMGINAGNSVAAHFTGAGKARALSNVGITPADYETMCKVSDGFGRTLNQNVGIGQPARGRIVVKLSRGDIEESLTQSKDTAFEPIIVACITYRSAVSNEYFQTLFTVIITRRGRGTLDLTTDPIPAAELTPMVFPATAQQSGANQQ